MPSASQLLERSSDPAWEAVAQLAADTLDVAYVAIAFLEFDHWWLKARVGWNRDELPAGPGLGLTALQCNMLHVVPDAREDLEAREHPLVRAEGLRFHASVPLRLEGGEAFGVLSVCDRQPRQPGRAQMATLQRLATAAQALLRGCIALAMQQREASVQPFLSETLHQMLWAATPDGFVDFMSAELRRITGIGALDLRATTWLEGVHPDDKEAARQRWEDALSQGDYTSEFRLWSAPARQYRWYLVQARPARDPAGRIARWYGSYVDIDDRKRAEEQVQRSEERMRTVLETQPECVSMLSTDGLVLDVNTAGLRLLEAEDKESLIGRRAVEFVHPDDLSTFEALYHTAMAGGTGEATFRTRTAAGNLVWTEVRAARLQLADGGTAIMAVKRDVSERLRAQQALAEAQQRNALILASTAEGIHGVDARGRLIFMNASALRMLGYAEDEVLGQDAFTLLHPGAHHGGAPRHWPLQLTLRDGHSRQVEGESFLRRDGSTFPVEYTVTAMQSTAGGAIAGAVLSFRDITSRKRHSELRALEARVLDRVGAGVPLREVLQEVVSTVDRLLPPVRASVHLEAGGRLLVAAAPRLPAEFNRQADGIPVAEGAGSCGTAAFRRQQVVVAAIDTDPLWRDFRELALRYGLHACWSTPVLGANDEVLATFAMYWDSPRSPQPHEQEVIARITGYLRMAIERTREREQLQRSERRYRSLYTLVPVAILEQDWNDVFVALAGLRQQGVTDLESHFAEHPGFVPGVLRGIRTLNANTAAMRMFGAADIQELIDALAAGRIGGAGLLPALGRHLQRLDSCGGTLEAELDLHTVDGRPLCVWLTMALPGPGEPGGRTLLSLLDITDRKEAEERFRMVAQTTSDVVWDWNLRTDVIWWNDGYRTVFGHDPDARSPGILSWTEYIHPQDRARVLASVQQTLAGDAVRWHGEYRFACADGSYLQVTDQAVVLRDETGKPVRMVGSLVDVTERRLLEDQLRQSQRLDAIGQLTGGVAHDFNNLLTVILGNAELLAEELDEQGGLHLLAGLIVTAAQRGAELANRLLAFARLQPLTPKPIDIGRQLDGIDELLERVLGEHIEVVVEHGDRRHQALADPGQLENAILNLCLNARDAMPGGGRLTLSASNCLVTTDDELAPGDYVVLSVSDTGCGMDEATLARAFDPFFTTKEPGKGSGLGLSMVYGFARQSQGHVRIASGLQEGTTVRLYLPRAAQAAAPAPTPGPGEPACGGDEAILLVEDNELVRNHVRAQLQRLGYHVTAVPDGRQALQVLQRDAGIDLLLTDVVMPGGLDGPQLARAARQFRPDLPVLFTSGFTDNAMGPQGRLADDVHLLPKPYRREDLAAKVRAVLQQAARA